MSEYIIETIGRGIIETLQMTFFASLLAYAAGLPLGILLYTTAKGRILANRPVNLVLGFIVNIMRSLPFLILLVLLIPFTRFLTGSSIGTTASVVPLTVGASPLFIILHFILPEATPSLVFGAAINIATVLGYSAMAGVIGGGGLGAIALQYGYYRYQKDVLFTTVSILVVMVMLIQESGSLITRKIRK